MEPVNLCWTCKKQFDCAMKGILERETCSEYDPLSLEEVAQRDEFINQVMVGPCPQCGSENTYDCDTPLELIIRDPTVGYCLDCGTYWCLECGFIFANIEKGTTCPHWRVCEQCMTENDYLDMGEFVEKVCPTCEHFADGCQLEDPVSDCERQHEYQCPYLLDVSECPTIRELLEA